MKEHYKRLIKFAVLLFVAIILVGNIFYPLFAVDAGNMAGAVSYLEGGSEGTSRVFTAGEWEKPGTNTTPSTLTEGFETALENDLLVLYFKEETGEIALHRKGTDIIWFSNPQDRAEETRLNGQPKEALGAQLTLSYYTERRQLASMDSVNDCVAYGGLESEVRDGTLYVTYQFGRERVTFADIPNQISAERFESFLEKADEETREGLLDYYTLLSGSSLSEAALDRMAEQYPSIRQYDLYYLNIAGRSNIAETTLQRIQGYWDSVGYTQEDLIRDHQENGLEFEVTVHARFRIVMEYSLDEESLTVKIDTSQMEYEENIPPYRLEVLPYFGSGGTGDEGYLFFPDGSGVLIYFNNGRTNGSYMTQSCYGKEETVSQTTHYQTDEGVKLPVFGIQKGDEALFAEITTGASKADITGYVSGLRNSYNAIYPTFTLIASELIRVTEEVNTTGIIMTEENPYDGSYEIRYTPLSAQDSGYSGMARYYRERLLKTGQLKQAEISESLPMVATLLGGVTTDQVVLGVTVEGTEALTDYEAAGDIAYELMEAGVDGLNVRYIGWFNGGIEQSYAGRVSYESALGGRSGFEALAERLNGYGIEFYPEVKLLEFGTSGKGFHINSMNIQGISRDIIVGYYYDAMNHVRDTDFGPLYRLKPSLLLEETEAFLEEYQYDTSLSLGDLGNLLSTDFDLSGPTNREEAIAYIREAAGLLSERTSLMAANPNLYVLEYASILTDVPFEDSYHEMADEAVPFYQMVVRGSVDYTTKPLNYYSDYQTAFLQAVEYGAGLNYLLMDTQPAALKDTSYHYFYTGAWTEWKETIIRDYARAAEALDDVQGLEMVHHERLQKKLFVTEYENGTRIYVNYADEPAEYGNIRVGAKDFKVVTE